MQIDAAYLTLEGMVIYNCRAYPPGGGVAFDRIETRTADGGGSPPAWRGTVRHAECGQKTRVNDAAGRSVSLIWNSST